MVPVIDTYPQYPPTYAATMFATPKSPDAFVYLTLGYSMNAIDLFVHFAFAFAAAVNDCYFLSMFFLPLFQGDIDASNLTLISMMLSSPFLSAQEPVL